METRAKLKIHAQEFNGILNGVTVVEGIWPNEYFIDGLGINALIDLIGLSLLVEHRSRNMDKKIKIS